MCNRGGTGEGGPPIPPAGGQPEQNHDTVMLPRFVLFTAFLFLIYCLNCFCCCINIYIYTYKSLGDLHISVFSTKENTLGRKQRLNSIKVGKPTPTTTKILITVSGKCGGGCGAGCSLVSAWGRGLVGEIMRRSAAKELHCARACRGRAQRANQPITS